jgi:hypothetical protein
VTPAERPTVLALWDLATTLSVVERLGVEHPALRARLEEWIPSYSIEDWLGFDPNRGPPPTAELRLEAEEACAARGEEVGAKACAPVVTRIPDLDVFYDAIITGYFGETFGTPFGARHRDVVSWLPQLYPYASATEWGYERYSDLTYIVTHVIYTENDYGRRTLRPIDFPEEHRFLLDSLDYWLAAEDIEVYAEIVDNLASFGHRLDEDPRLARAIASILAAQNQDGSWGDVEGDAYTRYHTTYNAIDALRVDRYRALEADD